MHRLTPFALCAPLFANRRTLRRSISAGQQDSWSAQPFPLAEESRAGPKENYALAGETLQVCTPAHLKTAPSHDFCALHERIAGPGSLVNLTPKMCVIGWNARHRMVKVAACYSARVSGKMSQTHGSCPQAHSIACSGVKLHYFWSHLFANIPTTDRVGVSLW